jgi:FtsH-binding integral membrane protein
VDLLLRKTRILAVIGTTLVGFGIAILAGLTIFDWGLIGKILAFGLIGAIPAAVCSWLSNEKQNMGADA